MPTLAQTHETSSANVKLLQVRLPEEAYRRIKIAAVMRDCGAAEIVAELAMRHLPPVPDEEARRA